MLVTQSTFCDPLDCSLARLLCSCYSPGKNTGVGCHALLRGIFLTQGLNPISCTQEADSLLLSHHPWSMN